MENWLKYKQKEKEFRQKSGYGAETAKKFQDGFKNEESEKKKKPKFQRLVDLLRGNYGSNDAK